MSVFMAKIATQLAWPLTRKNRAGLGPAPAVLCYHRVLPQATGARRLPNYAVTPEQFAEQMAVLVADGFTSLTLAEFREIARGRREPPERAVLITFDDGYADNYLVAWPIAQKFGLKINLFVCTGLVAEESVPAFEKPSDCEQISREEFPEFWQPLSWKQISEMTSAGVGLGFHSHNHKNIARMPASDLVADINRGASLLQSQLALQANAFAFPYGHYGSYSNDTIALLQQRGFEMLFTTELGRTPLERSTGVFSRIVVHTEDDTGTFRRKLHGGYDWIGRLRRFNYRSRQFLAGAPAKQLSEA
jgi:peptidoglycan/xylan/chitin deacetylase (PgdA/CDA1 family)